MNRFADLNKTLTLSTLGKTYSRRHIKCFSYFSKKTRRQYERNIKSYFLGKIRKNINLSSAELSERVVKAKHLHSRHFDNHTAILWEYCRLEMYTAVPVLLHRQETC